MQIRKSLSHTHFDEARYVAEGLSKITDLGSIRESPFGDILTGWNKAGEFFEGAKKNLAELVQEWHEWHRDQLEPIATYSLNSEFGRKLYEQQEEKKLVARFVANARVRDGGRMIGVGECVIIPEGTSGLYVGLALAAARRDVNMHTSNAGLIREYRDNPAIASGFHELFVIGGVADFNRTKGRSEYYTVQGDTCLSQYRDVLSADPPATVVIMTVSRLTADQGPEVSGETGSIKAEIIRDSLKNRVRELIFVADYTKHIEPDGGYAGVPIFSSPKEWNDIVEKSRDRIRIVTAPPSNLRAALAQQYATDVLARDLKKCKGPQPFNDCDMKYDREAKALYCMLAGDKVAELGFRPKFHEACQAGLEKIVFMIDSPRDQFRLDDFVRKLEELAGDLKEFELRMERRNLGTIVNVVGSPNPVEHLSGCISQSDRIRQFCEKTNTVVVEGPFGGVLHRSE
ncbi:MAG: hypothetical protein A2V70_06685 [Planctomycetes bacterium RBG_13_63_9]|nr:MAG: hypothetical protein A2V70_06685 [Planctomycetes bacterium RBG_13_63_9]